MKEWKKIINRSRTRRNRIKHAKEKGETVHAHCTYMLKMTKLDLSVTEMI